MLRRQFVPVTVQLQKGSGDHFTEAVRACHINTVYPITK